MDSKPSKQECLLERKEHIARFLVSVFRRYGYLQSQSSPAFSIEVSPVIQEQICHISPETRVLSLGFFPQDEVSAAELIEALQAAYCGSLAVETQTCSPELQEYIWNLMEEKGPYLYITDPLYYYQNLCEATFFEAFLQEKYTSRHLSFLEGGESLIPMLNYLIEAGEEFGVHNFIMGMTHRGRLNVLTNVLDKPYRYVFMELEDRPAERGVDAVGDICSQQGYVYKSLQESGERTVVVLPNPSHLEAINPIAQGMVAALQRQGSSLNLQESMAIAVHGDGAFSGQGVVYETLQLSQLSGYTTGGTIHIVMNNHRSFSTLPREERSTPYCTDIAKAFGFPIFRVNAYDLAACFRVVNYALRIRDRFGLDVVIELCFSSDAEKRGATLHAFKEYVLKNASTVSPDVLSAIESQVQALLHTEFQTLYISDEEKLPKKECFHCQRLNLGELLARPVDVALDRETLFHMTSKMCGLPDNFRPLADEKAILDERMQMARGEIGYDWVTAEILAFASLLIEGFSLRMTGQDVVFGVEKPRTWLWRDEADNNVYSPLYHLSFDQGSVDILNSPLSEYATLGFEYGYAQQAKNTLVIWETQFGDFANGAQIIIDQFLSSGIQKWDFHSDVVLLLPHGYDGEGPEHSSARIERFLQLAANWNFQVVMPSSPVQYFRILREHTKRDLALPIVIFTPKASYNGRSAIEEFSIEGGFLPILEDETPNYQAKILILCSGAIYYKLLEQLAVREDKDRYACLRIESLYPLHLEMLVSLLEQYSCVESYVWLQEEPHNMGAYSYLASATQAILPKQLHCVSRPSSSSPATGSAAISEQEQDHLFTTLFSI